MLFLSVYVIGLSVWMGWTRKMPWRKAAKFGTTGLLVLWLISAAMFGLSLTNSKQGRIAVSDSYNQSNGGWFRMQSDTSRKAATEGLVSSLAIALSFGVAGGILIAVLRDDKKDTTS